MGYTKGGTPRRRAGWKAHHGVCHFMCVTSARFLGTPLVSLVGQRCSACSRGWCVKVLGVVGGVGDEVACSVLGCNGLQAGSDWVRHVEFTYLVRLCFAQPLLNTSFSLTFFFLLSLSFSCSLSFSLILSLSLTLFLSYRLTLKPPFKVRPRRRPQSISFRSLFFCR